MEEKILLDPAEIAEETVAIGVKKAEKTKKTPSRTLVLAIMAGAFIACGTAGSTMAAFNLLANPATYGLGKTLAGVVFSAGLMMVLIGGGELFTGNILLTVGALEKKISLGTLLKNWGIVYVGNAIGAFVIVFLMLGSGLFHTGDNAVGGVTVSLAAHKMEIDFLAAFIRGVLCNFLVCMAVWMCYGAKDATGKVLISLFIILIFVCLGYEHSIANMYYIPAGIFASADPAYAAASGLSAEALAHLNWGGFFRNIIPVTLGNIVGGSLAVSLPYWFSYLKGKKA